MPKNAVYFPDTIVDYDPELKRLCLLFDKIYMNEKDLSGKGNYGPDRKRLPDDARFFEYLQKNGIVVGYKSKATAPDIYLREEPGAGFPENISSLFDIESRNVADPPGKYKIDEEKRQKASDKFNDTFARIDAIELAGRQVDGPEFYPILKSLDSYKDKGARVKLVHLVHLQLPVPADDVSWEQLIDFRNDEETHRKYLALIDWINQLSDSSMKPKDFEDHIAYLLSEYQKRYKAHHMKFGTSLFGILLNFGSTVAETTVKRGFVAGATSIFSITDARINLMEREGEGVGSQIAYVHSARQEYIQ